MFVVVVRKNEQKEGGIQVIPLPQPRYEASLGLLKFSVRSSHLPPTLSRSFELTKHTHLLHSRTFQTIHLLGTLPPSPILSA